MEMKCVRTRSDCIQHFTPLKGNFPTFLDISHHVTTDPCLVLCHQLYCVHRQSPVHLLLLTGHRHYRVVTSGQFQTTKTDLLISRRTREYTSGLWGCFWGRWRAGSWFSCFCDGDEDRSCDTVWGHLISGWWCFTKCLDDAWWWLVSLF